MSVIRRPDVLGQSTRRHLLGTTAAAGAAAVELVTVGAWFELVVGDVRSVSTALVGTALLVSGAVVVVDVFDATTRTATVSLPRLIVPAIVHAACWIGWLLLAERLGGAEGIAVAAVALAIAMTVRFELERRVVAFGASVRFDARSALVPGLLVALGASALLATVEFVDWTFQSILLSLWVTDLTVDVGAVTVAFAVFGIALFVAHERRFTRELATR